MEKENKELEASKKQAYIAYGIAAFLFLLGLITFFYFLNDYFKVENLKQNSSFFDSTDNASSLGGMIASTTGLLWSLSGVILFAFNIRQTQHEIELQIKEMQGQSQTFNQEMLAVTKQSDLLLIQQKENTFNNILKNYFNFLQSFEDYTYKGKITSGYPVLNKMHSYLHSLFKEYMTSFNNSSFSNGRVLQYQYNQIWNGRYKSNLSAVVQNFIFIHKFIAQNFKEPELYYEQLYNCYSDAEKYIIAIYITNNTSSELGYIEPFNFTRFIQGTDFYDFNKNYLPVIISDLAQSEKLFLNRSYLNTKLEVDYDKVINSVEDNFFITYEVFEDKNNSEITIDFLKIDFEYVMNYANTSKNSPVDFEKGQLEFMNKKFIDVPFRKELLEGLKLFDVSRGASNNQTLFLKIKSELKVTIKSNNTSKSIQIKYEKVLEITYNNYGHEDQYIINQKVHEYSPI